MNTYTVSVALHIDAESEDAARVEALYQLRGISESRVVVTLDGPEPFVLRDDSISSWLHKLPDGYRELALANYAAGKSRSKYADSVTTALYLAFGWTCSPEGYNFWNAVMSHLYGGKCNLPTLPTTNA